MAACMDGPSSLVIPFEKGTSKREAMRIVHHEMTLFHKQALLEALREQQVTTRNLAMKQAFLDEGLKIINSLVEDKATGLGFDAIGIKPVDPRVAKERLETLWAKAINVEASKEEKRLKDIEKNEKEQKKKDDLAFKSKPEDLFAAVVNASVEKKLEEHGLIVDNMLDDHGQDGATITDVVQAVAKNGRTPGRTQGAAGKGKDKGSGKGKGKATTKEGKGKGKKSTYGKGPNNWDKERGKSKGKKGGKGKPDQGGAKGDAKGWRSGAKPSGKGAGNFNKRDGKANGWQGTWTEPRWKRGSRW